MATWGMRGQYLKNCNCVPNCPCDTWGYPAPHDFCEGIVGMRIEAGDYAGLDLSGLKWVAAVSWPDPIHEGDGTMELFIDESASEEQRDALATILSGQAGGPLFEIMASIVATVHGPEFVPIDWEFDKESRRARIVIDGRLETRTDPLMIPATEDEQRVRVQMPNGFEYKEAEVAQASIISSSGEIKLDWKGTHSSLADVEHTGEALVA